MAVLVRALVIGFGLAIVLLGGPSGVGSVLAVGGVGLVAALLTWDD